MTSFTRILIISAILWVIPLSGYSKSTSYYRMVGTTDCKVNVHGGQFITFISNICYESDINGISVNNGSLERKPYLSNSANIVYVGKAFCGDNAKFCFNEEKTKLLVVGANGMKYNFELAQTPNGITTSTFVGSVSENKTITYNDGPHFFNPNCAGSCTNSVTKGANSNSQVNRVDNSRQEPIKHACHRCNGKRRIPIDTNAAMYGMTDYDVYCSECGRNYPKSWGHKHITCPQCHGKGYFTTK